MFKCFDTNFGFSYEAKIEDAAFGVTLDLAILRYHKSWSNWPNSVDQGLLRNHLLELICLKGRNQILRQVVVHPLYGMVLEDRQRYGEEWWDNIPTIKYQIGFILCAFVGL